MFIGLVTCPYYGDVETFADGFYFTSEEDLKKVFKKSNVSHYRLEVKELKEISKLKDIPIRYSLLMSKEKGSKTWFGIDWDDQGQSEGQLYVNVPKNVRDIAMKNAKVKYPNCDFAWEEQYVV